MRGEGLPLLALPTYFFAVLFWVAGHFWSPLLWVTLVLMIATAALLIWGIVVVIWSDR